ncbi:MAG: hypothetical protein NZM35_05390 [Chitinophagales bacterium]|nr:hypothetical protein [Chitinophagales bacterium]MDW8418545.1 hypothetical protein [Chitinophagales bacterium]
MKRIITTVSLAAFVVLAVAQQNQRIILVKAPLNDKSRIALRELYGSALKMQVASTNEFVLQTNASAEEVKRALSAKIGAVETREITQKEFETLTAGQLLTKNPPANSERSATRTGADAPKASNPEQPVRQKNQSNAYPDKERLADEREGKHTGPAPVAKPDPDTRKQEIEKQRIRSPRQQ